MTARLQFESLFGVRAQCPVQAWASHTRLAQAASITPCYDLHSTFT